MAKIVGVVQVKGGAGRSTVATNLAGELSKLGRTVLIDGDMPQGTSASWCALRLQRQHGGQLEGDTAEDHRELTAKVTRYAKSADFIVLDGPPRIAEMTRAILMLADVSLLPVGTSLAELWATGDVVKLISEAQKVKAVDVRIVWTRHRQNTALAKEISSQAKTALKLPVMKTKLGLRVAYPEALGTGKTAAEVGDPTAKLELAKLVAEVRRAIK